MTTFNFEELEPTNAARISYFAGGEVTSKEFGQAWADLVKDDADLHIFASLVRDFLEFKGYTKAELDRNPKLLARASMVAYCLGAARERYRLDRELGY